MEASSSLNIPSTSTLKDMRLQVTQVTAACFLQRPLLQNLCESSTPRGIGRFRWGWIMVLQLFLAYGDGETLTSVIYACPSEPLNQCLTLAPTSYSCTGTFRSSVAALSGQCLNCRTVNLAKRRPNIRPFDLNPQQWQPAAFYRSGHQEAVGPVVLSPCHQLLRMQRRPQLPQAGSGYAVLAAPARLKHVLQPLFHTLCRREGRCQTSWQLQNRHCSLSQMKMPATSQQPWSAKHPSCWHSWLTCCSSAQTASCRVLPLTAQGAAYGAWP